ncbi:hypothetical protein [Enemella evansiae]|uniref:hypothetical protein n=1 Tax=Enemella evansiae TaxID=2016499 RepID=UPI00117C7EB5|nr:hypothetical protein [Enemella evansiae]
MKDGSAPEEFGPTHPTVRDIRREHWDLVHRVERLERRQFGMVQVTALVALIGGLFLPYATDEDRDLGEESLSVLSLMVRLTTHGPPEGSWLMFGVLPAVWIATVATVLVGLMWFAGGPNRAGGETDSDRGSRARSRSRAHLAPVRDAHAAQNLPLRRDRRRHRRGGPALAHRRRHPHPARGVSRF